MPQPRHLRAKLLAALLLYTCLTSAAPAAEPAVAAIVIRNFMFTPVSLQIRAGERVTWVNRDDEPHTVVSDSGLFRSAALDTGDAYSFRFDRPGTYRFLCTIHPRMVGTIVVQ